MFRMREKKLLYGGKEDIYMHLKGTSLAGTLLTTFSLFEGSNCSLPLASEDHLEYQLGGAIP